MFDFLGPNGLFLGSMWGSKLFRGPLMSKTVLGSTHVLEQMSFSMFPSILIFDFDLILENGFGSTHVVE